MIQKRVFLVALIAGLSFAACSDSKLPDDIILADPDVVDPAIVDYTIVDRTNGPQDLKIRFGITTPGKPGVTAVFNALHSLIAAPKEGDDFSTIIQLGDWIDLASLTVAGDAGGGAISLTTGAVSSEYSGSLLRITVIGKNSFNGINENGTTGHVVFQFQNIPGYHRQQAQNYSDPATGYLNSEIRAYLNSNFLAGLTAAGVPDTILWAPKRKVENFTNISEDSNVVTLVPPNLQEMADKLWLLTAYEMYGEEDKKFNVETAANQADFSSYYDSQEMMLKYGTGVSDYWLASSYNDSRPTRGIYRTYIESSGNFRDTTQLGNEYGIVPAFCVK